MKYIKKYLYPLLIAVLSIVSFFIGIGFVFITEACVFFFIMSFLFLLVAFAYGVISLGKDIIKKNFVWKRYIANISAIFMSAITLYALTTLFKPLDKMPAKRANCIIKLFNLGKSINIYANENNDYLPDCNQWCDLLILDANSRPQDFMCFGSDAIVGESSYAMNISLKGKKLTQVDPNTVVLFDTNYGKEPNGRNVTVSSRYSYKVLKEKGEDVSFFGENTEEMKVYKNRWNQAGGPEMLSAENHKGQGANILFADSSVRWIKKEDFNNLNWAEQ